MIRYPLSNQARNAAIYAAVCAAIEDAIVHNRMFSIRRIYA